jgi:hypothetical protein
MGMSGSKLKKSDINIGTIISNTVKHYGGKGGGKYDYGQGFITKKGISSKDALNFIKDNYFKANK